MVVVDLGLLWALGVEVSIDGSGPVDLCKTYLLSFPFQVEGHDRDWIFFISFFTVSAGT